MRAAPESLPPGSCSCAVRQSEYNRPTSKNREPPTMHVANYCAECGAQIKRRGWRVWLHGGLCDDCARRLGRRFARPLAVIAILAIAAFALGRYLRPAPPPLIIQRAANSPLSDLPITPNDATRPASRNPNSRSEISQSSDDALARKISNSGSTDEVVYLCGARTQKGTPCHRRVHSAGERCYQHKGKPAILPPEKLIVKS